MAIFASATVSEGRQIALSGCCVKHNLFFYNVTIKTTAGSYETNKKM